MKILMRNIGMTLHVIHKLRAQGLDNVKVNMDWQHLIMNGENLAEYAALLAAEGLLGHQHANSGWGTFDDDNMVGATAFMETLELAVELRRAGYGENGERLGFDLYPYTEDAVAAVRRSVLQWRFIDEVAAGSTTRRSARRSCERTRCARTSSSTPRSELDEARAGARDRRAPSCERGARDASPASSRTTTASSSRAATMDCAAPDTRLNAQRTAYTRRAQRRALDRRARGRRWATTRPSSRTSTRASTTSSTGAVAAFEEAGVAIGAVDVRGLPGDEDDALAPRALASPAGLCRIGAVTQLSSSASTSARRGVKALAISPDGDVLARAEEEYPLSTPRPGWSEQDPEDWWRATERCARRACRRAAAIGLSGQMHGLVALDERERVLRPAILWNDQRTARRVRRDRGARRARAADRADGKPRADRLHRAEAPLAAHATSPRSTRGSRTCCCRRTTSACA